MTVAFRRMAKCLKCGSRYPLEDENAQWIRNNPRLNSADGFVFMDKDIICHRYKMTHGREFQLFMFIEVKIMGAVPTPSQRSTMHMINQMFRTDRKSYTKKTAFGKLPLPKKVYSPCDKKHVNVKAFGYHLLRMNGPNPIESSEIIWDKKKINIAMLEKILRFDVDPDSLNKMDFRIHHIQKKEKQLLLSENSSVITDKKSYPANIEAVKKATKPIMKTTAASALMGRGDLIISSV